MNKKLIASLLAVCSVTTSTLVSAKNVTLSSEPVPLTTAVSKEFYQFSKQFPAANTSALMEGYPAGDAEWHEFIATRDAAAGVRAQALSEQLGATIVKDTIAGVSVYWITPKTVAPELKDKLFVAVQGGGYLLNGGLASTTEGMVVAHHMQIPVLAIDYSKGPESPAPAGRDDIVTVWRALLKDRTADSMVMGGSSAGGALSVLAVQELNRIKVSAPAGLYVGTPSVDMTFTGDSRHINEGVDHILGSWRGLGEAMVDVYVGNKDLSDPLVSPINGSFENFPPSYLITGTRDLLLSDTIRLDRALKRAGNVTELNVYEGQSHGDYMAALGTPESNEHYQALSRFMRANLL
ncbi:alpha/beta hydrolase [Vibrio sp. ZSDZ34]|uniref:Alpha/beta hydrolase n=1 Tax=Vibrio gelatinilyticus TaxID=2893468 RepID=A0A9X1WGN7_9VIBR|nr:alpha/beta hydrolase fold domain-containing protein [Vibrio gelatinilyticus]MCJ2376349.1 alpha/beta hydrolase [Vibrio gelatinilyticus]